MSWTLHPEPVDTTPTPEQLADALAVLQGRPLALPAAEPRRSWWRRVVARVYRIRRVLAPLAGMAAVFGCAVAERLAARTGGSPWPVVVVAAAVLGGVWWRARARGFHPREGVAFAVVALVYLTAVACGA